MKWSASVFKLNQHTIFNILLFQDLRGGRILGERNYSSILYNLKKYLKYNLKFINIFLEHFQYF